MLLNNEPIIKRFEEETKANSDKIINALKKNEYLTKNINTIIPLFNERLNNFVKFVLALPNLLASSILIF